MKKISLTIAITLITIYSHSQSQTINIVIPTPEDESTYIWQNIQNIAFFDRNGYSVAYPHLALMNNLLNDSRNSGLKNSEFDKLVKSLKDSVYNKNDYLKGYEKIELGVSLIEKAITKLSDEKYKWGFVFFPEYKIKLTLYGPGGSYDNNAGSVLLQTYPDGRFKGYNNPINTIIHEIIHIGIEQPIIQKYNLPHTTKERIVDLFVKICFGDLIPNYRIQEFGDKRIDKYLTSVEDFENLPNRIEQFLKESQQ